MTRMIVKRDFSMELGGAVYNNITYTIYNMIDDDMFVYETNKEFGEIFSVDDFEYFDFDLTDKEKFLLKMRNKEFLSFVTLLKKYLSDRKGVKVYVYHDDGIVRIVKLKKVSVS